MGIAGRSFVLVFGMIWASAGHAAFDHEVPLDTGGIWARSNQTDLEYAVIAAEIAGSLWFGNDTEVGHTFFQTVDASVISGVAADVLKYATGRPRPYQNDSPEAWFKGNKYQSFPSGEVTLQASFVTPFIAGNWREHPWIWSLELLPIYDAVARVKSHAHWQSDVIAGWALGTGVGYWASTRTIPFSVQVLPHGLSVGLYKRF
jgi:membrane-associated phospholipid phosphatase